MIRRILRLLLPTSIYVWIYYLNLDGTHIGWQDAKSITINYEGLIPVNLLDRVATWAIVLCASYIAAHVIHAIVQGRLL